MDPVRIYTQAFYINKQQRNISATYSHVCVTNSSRWCKEWAFTLSDTEHHDGVHSHRGCTYCTYSKKNNLENTAKNKNLKQPSKTNYMQTENRNTKHKCTKEKNLFKMWKKTKKLQKIKVNMPKTLYQHYKHQVNVTNQDKTKWRPQKTIRHRNKNTQHKQIV